MPIIASAPQRELGGNDLNAAILLKWGVHPSVRLWRANSGTAWVKTAGGGARPITMNVEGCSDLLGLVGPHGRLLAIETKGAGDKMRESQENFRAMVERLGGLYIVARSVEDVDRALEAAGVRRAA